MSDQVLLSAGRHNIEQCVALASERGLGIEVMAFAFPDVLDGDWKTLLKHYKQLLAPVPGKITMHGPFLDMVSGSPDDRINDVCRHRYLHALDIAAELGSKIVVLHANFIGSLHNVPYRNGWHLRNIDFWRPIAESAAEIDVTIVLENMWEFDPGIIGDLLAAVNHPNLRACIDVGHAHLFSDSLFTLLDWFNVMEPWLLHTHMNNNNGKIDEHHSFDFERGVINYPEVLRMYRGLPSQPPIVLEMDTVEDMRASLHHLNVGESAHTPVNR
ncbi:MAG: sugar phosphate isomerase/epimerase [Armatimonadetes bacterium]|nr:sugar phosphate isomerase/epimerase [Anaerolineae bacterium]